MAAAAHNPKFAKDVGIPVSVAREYNRADARRAGEMAARAHRKKGKR